MAAMATRDEELSSVITQLLRVEGSIKSIVEHKDALKKWVVGLRAQISKFIKVESTLEASIRDSVNMVDEMNAEVVNLKEIMHCLEEMRVVSEANLRSLSEHRVMTGKAREYLLQFEWAI